MSDPAALTRIEMGRVPLQYSTARMIWLKFPKLNPWWLATGIGEQVLDFELSLPRNEEIDVRPKELFSAVIAMFQSDLSTLSGKRDSQRLPLSWIPSQRANIERRSLIAEREKRSVTALHYRINEMEARAKEFQRNTLTELHDSVNKENVSSPMVDLLARLRVATEQRGQKTRLASHLGVPLAAVSQWLSGDREPSGETTLRLLYWVEEEEKKQKGPGGATNTARAKTRSKHLKNNENSKSGSP